MLAGGMCLFIEKLKNNWLLIVLACVVVIFLFIHHGLDDDTTEMISQAHDEDEIKHEASNEDDVFVVDVKGEVEKPGVYEIDRDLRVDDVIKLAGGFTSEADEFMVNLAEKIHDEMIIIVPSHKEDEENHSTQDETSNIHINSATKEDIETLPGIGPTKAEAIIDYREEFGYFQTLEDLLNVSGIGEKTLENIEEYIQVP